MDGTIYKIENLVNGKVYVGQTIRAFDSRKRQHLYELRHNKKRNKKLQSSWNKYGEENFDFSVIGRFPCAELDEKEIFYIGKFDSFRNGYNMTTGGNQVMHTQKHTEETRNKMSVKLKTKWQDEDFIKTMKKRPIYYGSEAPRAIRIICINDNKVFNSLTEASTYYGVSMKKISSVICGSASYTGLDETGRKLQFSRYEEGESYEYKEIKNCNEKRRVICLDTGEIFKSYKEAQSKTGAPAASIAHVCKGRRKKAGNLRWDYYYEYEQLALTL